MLINLSFSQESLQEDITIAHKEVPAVAARTEGINVHSIAITLIF